LATSSARPTVRCTRSRVPRPRCRVARRRGRVQRLLEDDPGVSLDLIDRGEADVEPEPASRVSIVWRTATQARPAIGAAVDALRIAWQARTECAALVAA
jgi:hypothetical protein